VVVFQVLALLTDAIHVFFDPAVASVPNTCDASKVTLRGKVAGTPIMKPSFDFSDQIGLYIIISLYNH
jgi:hypothetical protein